MPKYPYAIYTMQEKGMGNFNSDSLLIPAVPNKRNENKDQERMKDVLRKVFLNIIQEGNITVNPN